MTDASLARSGPGRRGWPWVGDALAPLLAAALAVVLAVSGGEDGARVVDPLAAGLLALAALPLLVCGRWPEAALVGHLLLLAPYFALNYPGGAPLPLTMVGVYAVALRGRRVWTVGLLAVILGVSTAWRLLVEREDPQMVAIIVVLLALVAVWGDSVHTRRRLAGEIATHVATAAAEKEAEARRRVAEERLRLAHELHDVMAHTITTMTVQAGAAGDQLGRDPERAREAFASMRTAARDAMAELRSMVAVLRGPGQDAERAPLPGLAQLEELIRTAAEAGVKVEVVSDVALDLPLPAVVDLTCYRVIQEALTNVVRHAAASRATVNIHRGGGSLTVEVTDDGRGPQGDGRGGLGLLGLRERAAVVGGRLQAGPGPDGGFRVTAVLPVTERP